MVERSPCRWAFVLLAGALSGCGLVEATLAYYGIYSERQDPDVLNASLEPYDEWFLPASRGSEFPGVLLVPGCAGTHSFHRDWGRFFAESGFAALLIDSFKARGVTTRADLDAVCEGTRIWGFERAGDVLLSLERLRSHPSVDPDNVYLMGWSHGGWTVMDAVILGARDDALPLLSRPLEGALRGVRASAALYPYCGFGSHIGRYGWAVDVRGLVIVASQDQNVEPEPCIDHVTTSRADGQLIELLRVDADHWFDNPRGTELVPHRFDPDSTRIAKQTVMQLFRSETGG